MMLKLLVGFALVAATCCSTSNDGFHPTFRSGYVAQNGEDTAIFWVNKAEAILQERLVVEENKNEAKNIILFLGDGMSVPTLAATRVLMGNENAELSFDKFPYTAVSKTYCVDAQVADSACTATAYLTGVKANYNTLGVTAAVPWGNCSLMKDESNHVASIAAWSQAKGKSTGIVTTSTVVDASPGGAYAHTAKRQWQSDTDLINDNEDPKECIDIATQLITGDVGKNFNVILGGGYEKFLPPSDDGDRSDNVNLVNKWKDMKKDKKATVVKNKNDLANLDKDTEYVLGLFTKSYMPYNLDRDTETIPSLEEMTEAAIKVASKNEKGYFLFIEGGLIDHGHHENKAWKALDETVEFSKAIQKAVDLTSDKDTLIVVTADHAHTMSLGGYSARSNKITDVASEQKGSDNIPYRTLSYANGPGFKDEEQDANNANSLNRHDPSKDELTKDYTFPATVPLESETHGGDDVLIFAKGPWAHLFSGVMEENAIPHIMGYAACVKDGNVACKSGGFKTSSVSGIFMMLIVTVLFKFFY